MEVKPLAPLKDYLWNNQSIEKCILKNKEGYNHRPEKSKDDINKIISAIPSNDLKRYYMMKDEVLQMLEKASSC